MLFAKKTLLADAKAAYDKVRAIRAQQQRQAARAVELRQTLPALRTDLAAASAALDVALVARAIGETDTTAQAKAAHASALERLSEAEAESRAMERVAGREVLEVAEQAARDAREKLAQSIVNGIRATLRSDPQVREAAETLYAMGYLAHDARIGYSFNDPEAGTSWQHTLAFAVGVNPQTNEAHDQILTKHAALLPTLD